MIDSGHVIADFHGDYYWLDNMFLSPIEWAPGLTFQAVEYGFVYFKTTSSYAREQILKCPDPYDAKAYGREMTMRPDWDEIKFGIMYKLVERKFEQNQELVKKLLNTGTLMLVEGNTWHDNIWGDCICRDCRDIPGQNMLGKTLMSLRAQYREVPFW